MLSEKFLAFQMISTFVAFNLKKRIKSIAAVNFEKPAGKILCGTACTVCHYMQWCGDKWFERGDKNTQ